MVLSYEQRQAHWEWCREYIDRQAIWRADSQNPSIPGKAPGSTYIWQFYLRRAIFNPKFSRRLGLLWWDRFLPVMEQREFQIGACHPSGPAIALAIQAAGTELGITCNAFLIRREPKAFGTDNWFDGRVSSAPVLMVDDAAASAPFLLCAAARVRHKLKLPLHYNWFTIVNKVGRGFNKVNQHTENYLSGELVSFFTMNNFCRSVEQYRERYGENPKWSGFVR